MNNKEADAKEPEGDEEGRNVGSARLIEAAETSESRSHSVTRALGKTPSRWTQPDHTRSVQGRSKAVSRTEGRPGSSLRQRVAAASAAESSNFNRSTHKLVSGTSMIKRVMPKNIMQDKEQLYDEVMRLKKSLNDTKQENVRLKTQAKQAENELSKNGKLVKELTGKLNRQHYMSYGMGTAPKSETHLVLSLKKLNKEVRRENRALRDEIDALHKDIKLTTAHEIEVEARMYADECIRMRKMLDDIMGGGNSLVPAMEERPPPAEEEEAGTQKQDELIASIKQENAELSTTLKKREEIVSEYREKLKGQHEETEKSQKLVKEKEAEITALRHKLEEQKANSQSNKKLAASLSEKDDAIRSLEMKLVEIRRAKDIEIKKLREQQLQDSVGAKSKPSSSPAKKLPPVSPQEIASASAALRLNLILSHTSPQDLISITFSRCVPVDPLSIHELSRTFARKPASLRPGESLILARYLVEPVQEANVTETEFNELAEQKADTVMEKLKVLLGEGLSAETIPGMKEQVLAKLSSSQGIVQAFKSMESQPGIINAICVEAVNTTLSLHLTRGEMDYLLLPMYEETHDVNWLNYETLVKFLKSELGCDLDPKKPQKSAEIAVMKEEKVVVNENAVGNLMMGEEEASKAQRRFSEPQESAQPLFDMGDDPNANTNVPLPKKPAAQQQIPSKKLEDLPGKKRFKGQGEGMNEDQMIEIAQRCFYTIAEQMSQKKLTVFSLYQDVIFKKKIEGEEVELISPLDFLNGLRKLGIDDLQTLDYTCLIKVLAINDEEKHIRVSDLVQILEDYGITEQNSVEGQLVDELRFEDLDKVSMVLMLALTEYLIKAKVPLYDLFGDAIYKQEVQVDSKQLQVDLVNSGDFFEVLRGIGINTEEKEHENLKAFLCLDTGYADRLMVKKIKRAIEEFAVNEELRAFAQRCYQELVDEDQLEDVQQKQKVPEMKGGQQEKKKVLPAEGNNNISDGEGNEAAQGNTTL